MYFPLNIRDWIHALGLAVLTAVVWLWFQDGWSGDAWRVPAAPRIQESYTGDELEFLARVRTAQEKGWGFLTDSKPARLGAPWMADWSAYAMSDMPLTILTGKLANRIGLIPAANTALLAAHLLAVLAFYFCSRTLGHRPVFAACAALLFSFSYFNCRRSLVHFSFTLSFIVPLILLVVILAGSSRVLWQRRAWWSVCAIIALWTGIANPYYGFIFLQLLGFALLYRRITQTGPHGLPWRGLALLGLFGLTLVASNWQAITALWAGPGSPLVRNYSGTEIYSLRIIELFIPPPSHPWFAAATLGQDYAAASVLKGEFYYPYLGMVALGGLLLLTVAGLRRLLGRRFGLRPFHLPLVAWILLYSCTGGLNSLLAFAVTPLFRGTNRFSIFILALVLLALAGWATRFFRHRPRHLVLAVTMLVAAFGLWDQCPVRQLAKEADLRAKVDSDRQLAQTLESILPAGATVFQLPAVPFLEQPVIHRMLDNELFRPYLFTRNLRFSHGALSGSRELRWQQRVAQLPAPAMRAALESAGFSAVYVQRAAFTDSGHALSQQLQQAGLTPLFSAGDHLVYKLHPSGQPVIPRLDDPRLYDAWPAGQAPGNGPTVLIGRGWFRLETDASHSWRWAGNEAVMLLHNPFPVEQKVELACLVTTIRNTNLDIRLNGQVIWQAARSNGAVRLPLRLAPGFNELHWQTTGPTMRASLEDDRSIGLRVTDLSLEPAPQP